jgi:hypothetical protein
MRIRLDPSTLRQTKWYELLIRFVFGGFITAAAGVIALKFGPVVGGLFLAFPAIFPASATLIESHEAERKAKLGLNGKKRGRLAAGLNAAGALSGAIGLIAFGALTFFALPRYSAWLVLGLATIAWFITSAVIWFVRQRI